MARIMFQGTGSSVGKSILVTALCRILKQDGYKVVPFKSQNMSLNSYITLDGKEMGRAQVLQAYACGMEPEAFMNPILLKPTGDKNCQVIVNGKVHCNCTAMEYHKMKPQFSKMLKEQFEEMEKEYDVVVMEGAGSPAEINLRDNDIVNMGMAELVDAPVLLIGDIDKGGVFASLAGTMVLFNEEEKKRVKGTIINKFRGDVEILKPGLTMLEDIIKVPTLGVVPYFRLALEDEDGAVKLNKKVTAPIDIAAIRLPHVSNFTDLDALKIEEDVSVRFVEGPEEFGEPDLVVILGSKNTIEDLNVIRESGLEHKIKAYGDNDGMLIGICGGYQMLGKTLKDPYHTESSIEEIEGMGLLDIETVFEKEKVTTRVKASNKDSYSSNSIFNGFKGEVYGYEIHMGICNYGKEATPLFNIYERNGLSTECGDGAINSKGNIMGTYIHGIFDGVSFRENLVNILRVNKGIEPKKSEIYENIRERELDKLADLVRSSLDMDKVYEIIEQSKK
ncbi:cobyric acid synthase [Hathewaya histolytica]|uniref:Cobyric acid synthase n=1 Tax=Hathewaya histolytica TaxID=1498 RepID=A0A4U9R4H8_HATHI|nr:cobyric acid synthase [Hathewaya histolytica]VTQ86272.1 cobyric acid synthase [Hathewaya histolytica]